LSRRFFDEANIVIRDKQPRERSENLPEDRTPLVLRLVLPASMIADYEAALVRFKMQQFALNLEEGVEKDVSHIDFFQRMLDCEEKSQTG
jgi:hypothetical protein